MRTILTVAGVMLTVLCLSGGVTGYILYNRASAPERTSPDVAVMNYLRSFLIERNDARAGLYTCQGSDGRLAMEEFREQIQVRERELDVSFLINIEDVSVVREGPSDAVATVVIKRSAWIDGIRQSVTDRWRFELRDINGWRVCRAEQS